VSGDGGTTPSFPNASNDTTPASLARSGHMRRWATPTATIGGFTTTGTGSQQRLGVAPATGSVAGVLTAADKTLLNQITTGGPWIAFPYGANWSDLAGGNGAGLYKKDPFGRVWLSGVAKKVIALALPDIIGTLPVGYRPIAVHRWLTVYGGVNAEIYVDTAGVLRLLTGGAATGVSLDGIQFDPLT
jgi:hypothetical protein